MNKYFVLGLVTFVVTLQGEVFSASIPSYDLVSQDEKTNFKSNLVNHDYDAIEGLHPPKTMARNYYDKKPEKKIRGSKYVVEITRTHLRFLSNPDFPIQQVKLLKNESEGIQKLSLAFVKLLNYSALASPAPEENISETTDWRDLDPIVTLSSTGVSVQFVSSEEEFFSSSEESSEEDENPENRQILWDFLTNYARNIIEENLKDLKESQKYAEVFGLDDSDESKTDPFRKFLDSLWKIMRLSVSYAETAATTPIPENTPSEVRAKSSSTLRTVFSFEEPIPYHIFPSEELDSRRRDVDSIFYGRGII